MSNVIAFKVPMQKNMSIRVEECDDDHVYDLVHFHEECQLTCIVEGSGYLLAGSETYCFEPGEVYLFGSNLPHGFKTEDKIEADDMGSGARRISIFFNRNVFESLFEQNPETSTIKNLLDNASLGYKLGAGNSPEILSKIRRLRNMDDFDKVLELLDILDFISNGNQGDYLSAREEIEADLVDEDIHMINEVFAYTESNFKERISLADVAGHFKMTPPTFSRFFKSRTQKTYIQFLIELRITKACEFIRAGTHNTTESCFNSGFTNISSFHRHFKTIKGMTPTEYKLRVSSNFN
ncbi:AraC family transcriptional regulator [Arenibacter sp. S6351L]|uniref:AraC family transcriptional regulator n=1 Tax=Arenibacter sp. S6351L TaxID=2926407 RepID=UPI001FF3D9C9|nr:AraC family transcriptional regulator [Arenibacter sp. S6351L]MCK0134790.1 AraC family transcriptional regulator [Arenibacter sp. S6351L]